VRISIEDLDPRILPDMGVKVRFFDDQPAAGAQPAVASVPAGAVLESGDEAWVWRVEEGRVRRIGVTAGPESEGRREVLSGLAAGDIVVVDPPEGLGDGDRVVEGTSGTS
jgi:hypothetical protein